MISLLVEGCFTKGDGYVVHAVFYLLVIIFLFYLSALLSSRFYKMVKPILVRGNDRGGSLNNRGGSLALGLIVSFVFALFLLLMIDKHATMITCRVHAKEAISLGTQFKTPITEYYEANQSFPESIDMLTGPKSGEYVESVKIDMNGKIIVRFKSSPKTHIAGKTIVFTPNIHETGIKWDCVGGTLPSTYRLANCR